VSNWLLGDFSRLLNAKNIEINEAKVTPSQLCELLDLVNKGIVSGPAAKQVWEEMFNTGNPLLMLALRKLESDKRRG